MSDQVADDRWFGTDKEIGDGGVGNGWLASETQEAGEAEDVFLPRVAGAMRFVLSRHELCPLLFCKEWPLSNWCEMGSARGTVMIQESIYRFVSV